MNKKKILIIIGLLIFLAGLIYLLLINITGNTTRIFESIEDIKNNTDMKAGDCWKLKDGRKVCYFGKTNISSGAMSELNSTIKEE